jgi:hypothetical protein
MLMFSIDVGCIHTLFRLNQEIHHNENEQYPKFYEGTSKLDYNQAIYVVTHGDSVTIKELPNHFFPSSKCPW